MYCQYEKTILMTDERFGYRVVTIDNALDELPNARECREQQLRDFISKYKDFKCLWDIRCKDYSNRDEKKDAYSELLVVYKLIKPEVKRRKVSTKVDYEHHSQHFFENTKEEMKITVYNSVIDKMLNGVKVRFSQDTLNLIDSVGNLLKLEIEKKHLQTISDTFGLSFNQLDNEVRLFHCLHK
ncbi:hypothetical protein QTP88_008150 [Uroleucon formosanum]